MAVNETPITMNDTNQLPNALQVLIRDEAIAHWGAINKLREAIVNRATQEITRGSDPAKWTAILENLSASGMGAFTEKILSKLI